MYYVCTKELIWYFNTIDDAAVFAVVNAFDVSIIWLDDVNIDGTNDYYNGKQWRWYNVSSQRHGLPIILRERGDH